VKAEISAFDGAILAASFGAPNAVIFGSWGTPRTRTFAEATSMGEGLVKHVECGSCRACCKGSMVILQPEDDRDSYQWVWFTPTGKDERLPILAHQPNGDCVYLGPDGCTIHERHPVICRRFDCAEIYAAVKHLNPPLDGILTAGKRQLEMREEKI
jgi:hypothetical protein